MDGERILVAASLTAAAVVGAFVFWGPAANSAAGGGRGGRLAGLVNLGKTCFLNAILHALAACPHFLQWLDKDSYLKDTSLRSTLSTVLSVVNGTNKSIQDSYAPAAVINALKRLGWVIPAGEQDAHELLNVILTTLDEETHKVGRKAGCLSDALGMTAADVEPQDAASSSSTVEFNSMGSVMSLNELCRPTSLAYRGGSIRRNRWISRSCRAVQLTGPPTQPIGHPFTGTLTSQLRCSDCGYKSAVRYDKFESLSLALPSGPGDLGWGRHKLHQLLANFVQPEVVADVLCDGCNTASKQIKILNFGKLPMCLCVHISRNTWQQGSGGGMTKRQDYVQFPMRLSMTAYTFVQVHYQRRFAGNPSMAYMSTSEGGSPLSSTPMSWNGSSLGEMSNEFRNVYQLQAVLVHSGDAHTGHFVTYRRGHQNNRWYYTSDVEIREVTVDEVLQSTAYMLFYEKTTTVSNVF